MVAPIPRRGARTGARERPRAARRRPPPSVGRPRVRRLSCGAMAHPDPLVNPRAFEDHEPGWTAPSAEPREGEFENSLRPQRLAEFVGQRRVAENLRIALEAARARGEALVHVLFSGPPGLGKTSLARILAAELGVRLHATAGPALDRPRDLVGILTQLQPRDVLFVDEVHRIPAAV